MVLGLEVSWKVFLTPMSLQCAVAVNVESSNRLDWYLGTCRRYYIFINVGNMRVYPTWVGDPRFSHIWYPGPTC